MGSYSHLVRNHQSWELGTDLVRVRGIKVAQPYLQHGGVNGLGLDVLQVGEGVHVLSVGVVLPVKLKTGQKHRPWE